MTMIRQRSDVVFGFYRVLPSGVACSGAEAATITSVTMHQRKYSLDPSHLKECTCSSRYTDM